MEAITNDTACLNDQLLNLFNSIIDTIKYIFSCCFETVDREDVVHERLVEGMKWTHIQEHRISDSVNVTPIKKETTDPIHIFFRKFFENLGTSYFKVKVIEQAKTAISHGLSEAAKSQAENVIKLVLKDSDSLDLEKPWIRNIVNNTLAYLLNFCSDLEEQREVLLAAIGNPRAIGAAVAISLNSTVEEMETQLGKGHVKPVLKKLASVLGPKLLRSDRFIESFSGSIYRSIRPLVESGVGEGMGEVSPVVQAVARIGSMLVGDRVAQIFKNLNIKNLFDEAIHKGMKHLEAHRNTYEALPKESKDDEMLYYQYFATQEGCHPLAKKIIHAAPGENVYPLVMDHFEEISRTIVNYVFEDQVVENFVTDLGTYREDLLKDIEDPLMQRVLEAILLPGNREVFSDSIKALKPLAIKALAQVVYLVGIKKIFSKKQIYKVMYRYIAPAVSDVIQRVMIKKLVMRHLKDTPFMEEFAAIYDQYRSNQAYAFKEARIVGIIQEEYLAYVHSSQHLNIKHRLPELATQAFKEMMDSLRSKGWRLGGLTTFEEEIKQFNDANYSDQSAIYGQFIMMALFGIAKKGIVLQVARHGFGVHEETQWLTDIFTDIFLNGVYDLRGVDRSGNPIPGLDTNQVFFELIREAIQPYEDSDTVTDLLQAEEDPWDAIQIEGHTKVEADSFAATLYDLIGISSGSKAVAFLVNNLVGNGGLPGQLEFAVLNLFGKNLSNYSLLFHVLDILNKDIKNGACK